MMLVQADARQAVLFDPKRYRIRQAALNYGIAEAKRALDIIAGELRR
jgi:hypothetical protein